MDGVKIAQVGECWLETLDDGIRLVDTSGEELWWLAADEAALVRDGIDRWLTRRIVEEVLSERADKCE